MEQTKNNKQSSSVEWLIDQLDDLQYNPLEKNGYVNAKNRILEQAKAIHKDEIIKSWMATDNELQRIAAEQYYNETFGGNK